MRRFRITLGGRSHEVAVERGSEPGLLRVSLDGEEHLVQVEEESGGLPANPGGVALRAPAAPRPVARPAARPGGAAGEVRSPLPGVILSVAVQAGEAVEAGATLLTLEAMKMETKIYAPGPGKVLRVGVAPGQKVETGQVLVEIG